MKIAIQGELGSNSHMAVAQMMGLREAEIVACTYSADVFERLREGAVDGAVLPIENSLHGAVAEHYDLLLEHPVRVAGETLLRIKHNVIAMPGVKLGEVRRVMSHPVALSQCRKWLGAHRELEAVPFYDTAGSVKSVMASGDRTAAGIATAKAAEEYGAEILVADVGDNPENFTRFFLLKSDVEGVAAEDGANKLSVAFAIEHRPGSLVAALARLAEVGVDLTKIESRPVPGRPWEYVFYVDVRFEGGAMADSALLALAEHCSMVKELGRYRAA